MLDPKYDAMQLFQDAIKSKGRRDFVLDIVRKDCIKKIVNLMTERYDVNAELAQDQAAMIFDECFAVCFDEKNV